MSGFVNFLTHLDELCVEAGALGSKLLNPVNLKYPKRERESI